MTLDCNGSYKLMEIFFECINFMVTSNFCLICCCGQATYCDYTLLSVCVCVCVSVIHHGLKDHALDS